MVDLACELASDLGEPWTVIQRRGQFGNPANYFQKPWADYKNGFGDVDGEFWLGLDNMATVTTSGGNWEMRVELTDWDGTEYHALYDHFGVGPGPNYRLSLTGFNRSGSTLQDSLAYVPVSEFERLQHRGVIRTNRDLLKMRTDVSMRDGTVCVCPVL